MGLFYKKAAYDRTHLLRQACEQVRQKKYKRALPLLRQLVAREPHNPELHALIASPSCANTQPTITRPSGDSI